MPEDTLPDGKRKARRRQWIIGVGIFIVLITAILAAPAIGGKWYWKKIQEELRAKGEKLFAEDYQKPAIADEENYFSTPFFKEVVAKGENDPSTAFRRLREALSNARKERTILDGGKGGRVGEPISLAAYSHGLGVDATEEARYAETLAWMEAILAPWEAMRKETWADCGAPQSNSSLDLTRGLEVDLKLLSPCLNMATFCRFHSVAALGRKDPDSAFEDIVILDRTARAIADDPLVINSLVAMIVSGTMDRIIHDGMHLWTDDQLAKLDGSASSFEDRGHAGIESGPFRSQDLSAVRRINGSPAQHCDGRHPGPIRITRSGTSNAPIRIRGGIIEGESGIIMEDCHDVVLTEMSFELKGSKGTGVRISGNSSRIKLEKCFVEKCDGRQIGVLIAGSSRRKTVSDVTVLKCGIRGVDSFHGVGLRAEGGVDGFFIRESNFSNLGVANAIELAGEGSKAPRNVTIQDSKFIFSGLGDFKGRASTAVFIQGASKVANTMISGGRGVAIFGDKRHA